MLHFRTPLLSASRPVVCDVPSICLPHLHALQSHLDLHLHPVTTLHIAHVPIYKQFVARSWFLRIQTTQSCPHPHSHTKEDHARPQCHSIVQRYGLTFYPLV